MDSQETISMEELDNTGISTTEETANKLTKNNTPQSKGEILDYIKQLAQSSDKIGRAHV